MVNLRHPRRLLSMAFILPGMILSAAPAAYTQGLDHRAFEDLFGEPVTASATGKPQRASDVPVAMDIITADQIRRSGAHDIPTVLARYTSLDVQQYGAADYSVGVRGLTTPMSQRLLVLVDGRQVYLDDYGRTSWETIPVQLSEIRQIEVVRGPNSALYGFNAVSGVVNIVTFDPGTDRVTNATARLGAQGYRELSAVATAPAGEAGGLRLSAGLREQPEWSRANPTPAERNSRDPSRYQVAGTGQFRLAPSVRLSLDASAGRNQANQRILNGSPAYVDERTWSLRGRLTADTQWGILDASLYHNGLSGLVVLPDVELRHLFNQGVTVAQISNTLKPNASHTLRSSAEYRRNIYENGSGERISYDVASAGLMWNWAVAEDLETTFAGRWDQLWMNGSGYADFQRLNTDRLYDRDFGKFAWNAGLVWKPTPIDAIRITSARGIGSPSLIDLGVNMSSARVNVRGNPRLNPTLVDNYEIGWRRQVPVIDGRIGLSGFYEINRALGSSIATFARPVPGVGFIVSPIEMGDLNVHGVEASAAGKLSFGFDWGTEYRLSFTDKNELAAAAVDYHRASPRHLVSSRLGWSGGSFQADGFLRYASAAGGWRSDNFGRPAYAMVTDYASVGARIAFRMENSLTLALEGSNLLRGRQTQTIGFEAERQLFLSMQMDF